MALKQQWDPETAPELGRRRLHLRDVEGAEAGAAYDGVGADLGAARVRAGKELGDIASALRIGEAHLVAIEEGRFEDLPGTAYALGFLRSYAAHLGLDGTAVVEAFKDETSVYAARTKLVFPTPTPAGRSPGLRLIAVSLVLAAAVFAGWYAISERERAVVESVPEVPENLLATALETPARGDDAAARVDVAPRPAAAETMQAMDEDDDDAGAAGAGGSSVAVAGEAIEAGETIETGETLTLVAAVVEPQLPDDAGASATDAGAASAEAAPARALESQAAVLAPPAESFTSAYSADYVPQVYGAANTDARVVVIAHADSWVQVRGPGDEQLLTRVMRGGDRYLVPNRGDLKMLTGNAGALEIVVDGTRIAPIGEVGAVRRDISLNADRLLAENTATPLSVARAAA